MESEQEYIKLLRTLIKIGEANKGLDSEDERNIDAEGLLTKFLFHVASILYLSRSTTFKDILDTPISFFDSASINVLARSAFETFLVFHYVFIEPKSEEEKDFRYYSWTIAGLLERQKYSIQSQKGKEQLKTEREIIRSLEVKLKKNSFFKKLTSRQQNNLIKKGIWRPSWKDIGLSAGLNEIHAEEFYSYLCEYAHAGSLGIRQVHQAENAESQKSLFFASVGLIMIAMANMIKSYCSLFPKSNIALIEDEVSVAIVDKWNFVGSSSLQDVDIDWDKV
jgi:hypothetical protein